MFTRQQYLDGECSFDEYYQQFVDERILNAVVAFFGISNLVRYYKADSSFNTSNLNRWDSLALMVVYYYPVVRDKLHEAGDGWSNCGGVCILKTAAKMLVLKELENAGHSS